HLKVDGPIGPGKTRREPGRIIRYDPFRPGHQRLRSTPLGKLTVVWQPSDAVFTDGSRLSLVSDEPQTSGRLVMRSALPLATLVVCALTPPPPAVAQEPPTERTAAAAVIRRVNDLERSLAVPQLVERL